MASCSVGAASAYPGTALCVGVAMSSSAGSGGASVRPRPLRVNRRPPVSRPPPPRYRSLRRVAPHGTGRWTDERYCDPQGAARGDGGRRLRRAVGRAGAAPRERERYGRRPPQPPRLSAAALPGRHRGPLPRGRQRAHPRHPAQAGRDGGADGGGHRLRPPRPAGGAGGRAAARVRLPDRRHGRHARVLRAPGVGAAGAGAQDHRGRHPHPPPLPARLRGRRTGGGPRGAARPADLRRRRRGAHGGGDGGRLRRDRASLAGEGLSPHRPADGARHPAGRRPARAGRVRRGAFRLRGAGAGTDRRGGADELHRHRDPAGGGVRGGGEASARATWSGPPASPRRRWARRWAWRRTASGG